jgi:hypothetical protein
MRWEFEGNYVSLKPLAEITYWISSSSERHIEVHTLKFKIREAGGGKSFAIEVGVFGSFFSSITSKVTRGLEAVILSSAFLTGEPNSPSPSDLS